MRWAWWLGLAVGWAYISPLAADEQAILEVFVNGYNAGQQFVRLTAEDDVVLGRDVLESLRLREELWGALELPVALSRLRSALEFQLDREYAVLRIAVEPQWLEPQVVSRERATPPAPPQDELVYPQPYAGFLNYQLQATWQDQGGLTDFTLPWELGVNFGRWFASSTFTASYSRDSGHFDSQRQFSRLIWDDPDTLQTLVLGDFTGPYAFLGGGGNFGGISWRKNFGLDRQFKYYPDSDLRTVVDTPSHAVLYSSGRRVKEWDVLPGEVIFSDLGAYAGGDSELVLTDAFGRETRVGVPTLMTQRLLKAGLHEYSYNLGWARDVEQNGEIVYRRPALFGFHRYGFSDRMTAGVYFEGDQDLVNFGPEVASMLGSYGQAEVGLRLSDTDRGGSGWAAGLRYSHSYEGFGFSGAVNGYSRGYRDLGSSASVQTDDGALTGLRSRGSLNLNFSDPTLGGLSLNYNRQQRWDDSRNRQLSLNYRKQFGSGLLVWLGAQHNLDDDGQDQVFLNLIYYPKVGGKDRAYDNLSYGLGYERDGGRSQDLGIQRNFPRGPGYGYFLYMSEQDSRVSGSGRFQLRGDRGVYVAAFNRGAQATYSGSLSAAGSLAWIDGGIHAARPVTDSFALVRVRGLDDVPVRHQSSTMGTARDGVPLVVPELVSYARNQLVVEPQELPLNYSLEQATKLVEVGQRSGSIVDFVFTRFTAVDGNLYLQAVDGRRVELEALPLELRVAGEKREAFLGREGYFYLENLPPGKHELRVRRAQGDCVAVLRVPETDTIVFNLGAVACLPVTN